MNTVYEIWKYIDTKKTITDAVPNIFQMHQPKQWCIKFDFKNITVTYNGFTIVRLLYKSTLSLIIRFN